jgi:hypothetical protein
VPPLDLNNKSFTRTTSSTLAKVDVEIEKFEEEINAIQAYEKQRDVE